MSLSERERTAGYRRRMRAAGLRPVQIRVPDTSRPGFAEALRRQVERLQGQPEELQALDFIESARDDRDWTSDAAPW